VIVAAGAVPQLVQLLGPTCLARKAVARLLGVLAGESAENADTIVAAGAIPPLVQLLEPGSRENVIEGAASALRILANGNADHRAAIAAAIRALIG
jgi:hypothetical protein